MPTASTASWTVRTLSDSKSLLASTTFNNTSGTAFCFTTKYPVDFVIFLLIPKHLQIPIGLNVSVRKTFAFVCFSFADTCLLPKDIVS